MWLVVIFYTSIKFIAWLYVSKLISDSYLKIYNIVVNIRTILVTKLEL